MVEVFLLPNVLKNDGSILNLENSKKPHWFQKKAHWFQLRTWNSIVWREDFYRGLWFRLYLIEIVSDPTIKFDLALSDRPSVL